MAGPRREQDGGGSRGLVPRDEVDREIADRLFDAETEIALKLSLQENQVSESPPSMGHNIEFKRCNIFQLVNSPEPDSDDDDTLPDLEGASGNYAFDRVTKPIVKPNQVTKPLTTSPIVLSSDSDSSDSSRRLPPIDILPVIVKKERPRPMAFEMEKQRKRVIEDEDDDVIFVKEIVKRRRRSQEQTDVKVPIVDVVKVPVVDVVKVPVLEDKRGDVVRSEKVAETNDNVITLDVAPPNGDDLPDLESSPRRPVLSSRRAREVTLPACQRRPTSPSTTIPTAIVKPLPRLPPLNFQPILKISRIDDPPHLCADKNLDPILTTELEKTGLSSLELEKTHPLPVPTALEEGLAVTTDKAKEILTSVLTIDIDDSDDLPDLEAIERTPSPKLPPPKKIKYFDCFRSAPLHGRCDVVATSRTNRRDRMKFTWDQTFSIEGCLEDGADQTFLTHALWWFDYAIVDREASAKFTRRMVRETLLAAKSPELAYLSHRSLLRALELHPPLREIAYDGEYLDNLLSRMCTTTDTQQLLKYSLAIDFFISALQGEFFTRKLMDSRDLKRCFVQAQFGANSSTGFKNLKYVVRKLKTLLPHLEVSSSEEHKVHVSQRKIVGHVAHLLEMVIQSCPRSSETVDRISELLSDFCKDASEKTKDMVLDCLTSPVLKIRFIEHHRQWYTMKEVVASVKRNLTEKKMRRLCTYLEAQVVVAMGDYSYSLPNRLLKQKTLPSDTPSTVPSNEQIRERLTFTETHLETILDRVSTAMTKNPDLRPYYMRLEILLDSVFD